MHHLRVIILYAVRLVRWAYREARDLCSLRVLPRETTILFLRAIGIHDNVLTSAYASTLPRATMQVAHVAETLLTDGTSQLKMYPDA